MGDGLSKANWLEALFARLIPPACREEVLGDLHERNPTAPQYLVDAFRTVPLVIVSRIRRTSDPALLAMYAIVLYLAFFSVAWYDVRPLLYEPRGLWRLAIPCAVSIAVLVLEDAYANPGRASTLWWLRGPVYALAAIAFSQALLWAGGSSLKLPFVVVFRGGAVGFVLTFTIRLLFQPPPKSRRGPV
jgi:hypothetical protein